MFGTAIGGRSPNPHCCVCVASGCIFEPHPFVIGPCGDVRKCLPDSCRYRSRIWNNANDDARAVPGENLQNHHRPTGIHCRLAAEFHEPLRHAKPALPGEYRQLKFAVFSGGRRMLDAERRAHCVFCATEARKVADV